MIVAEPGIPIDPDTESALVSVINQQKTAFNELAVAQRDPEFQVSAEYNTTDEMETIFSTGTVGATGGQFFATTGTIAGGFSAIFTKRQIISKPGQGSEGVFTARFSPGVTGCRLNAGLASASDAVYFGFEGTEFGVFFSHDGNVIIQELTITTPATGSESTTVTIDGTGYTVPITSGTVEHNTFEIAASLNSQVPLYEFTQNEDQVVARSILTNPASGAFSFSSPGAAVGAWVEIVDGSEVVVEFTAQADWSEGAVFEMVIDPTLLNRYKVVFNGSIDYYIEDGITGTYRLVHRRVHTNVETTPMFSTAAFRGVWSAQSITSTTDLTVAGTETAAFNQGLRQMLTGTKAAFGTAIAVGTTATNIITIRCREIFGDKSNLGRVIPKAISAFTDGNKGAIVQICKNMVFTDEPNFKYIDKDESIVETENTQSEVSGGTCIASIVIGSSAAGSNNQFSNLLLPGETLTIAMNVPSGGTADMDASIIWEEDV